VLKRRADGAADASIHRELAHLHGAFALAVKDELLSAIPPFPPLARRDKGLWVKGFC
jgi:hypothetical protein